MQRIEIALLIISAIATIISAMCTYNVKLLTAQVKLMIAELELKFEKSLNDNCNKLSVLETRVDSIEKTLDTHIARD